VSHESVCRPTNPKAWSDILLAPLIASPSEWIEGQAFDGLRGDGKTGSFAAAVQLRINTECWPVRFMRSRHASMRNIGLEDLAETALGPDEP
jgi:hypothetical protein